MWPFLAALIASMGLALLLRDRSMFGTAAILLVNWAACTAFAALTGDPYPVEAFATFDYAAGFAIVVLLPSFTRPPTGWQIVVTLIYAAQLVAHAARAWADSPAAIYYGWYFLKYSSWAQAAVVTIWAGYELARHAGLLGSGASHRDGLLDSYSSQVSAPHVEALGGGR